MQSGSSGSEKDRELWQAKVGEYIFRRRHADALRLLEQVIERDMPLFRKDPSINASRRLAWLYRIDLLRAQGRLTEALAWACLECELYPTNVAALALKAQLKHQVGLIGEGSLVTHRAGSSSAATVNWPGVAGIRELKAVLERDVILPLLEPELYRQYKVGMPNGVLLYGPPGCGKTFIARKLAEQVAFHFIEVKPSDLASIYVHGGQERIGKLFEEAKGKAPCLLFFDELDALLPDRGADLYHHYAAEVNEFLSQLNDCAARRILVIGATNLLTKIDPAAKRPGRFDKKIYIGPPDIEARAELLKLCMADRPQDHIDWLALARECQGYTCAELELVVNESARQALDCRRNICVKDLMAALAANPPAHTHVKAEEDEGGR